MPFRSDGTGEAQARRAADRIARRAANAGLRQLRRSVPVRTGRMRAACRILRRAFGRIHILSRVPYAQYVDGYHRAVQIARSRAEQELRGFTVTVRFVDGDRVRRERVQIARSRVFRIGGGRNEITIRTRGRFRFRLGEDGRVRYMVD